MASAMTPKPPHSPCTLWPNEVHGHVATLLFYSKYLKPGVVKDLALKTAELFAQQAPNGRNTPEEIESRKTYAKEFAEKVTLLGDNLRYSNIINSKLFDSMIVDPNAPHSKYPDQIRHAATVMIEQSIQHFTPVLSHQEKNKIIIWADGYMRACLTEEQARNHGTTLPSLKAAEKKLDALVTQLATANRLTLQQLTEMLDFARLTGEQFSTSNDPQGVVSLELLAQILECLSLTANPAESAKTLIDHYTKNQETIFSTSHTSS